MTEDNTNQYEPYYKYTRELVNALQAMNDDLQRLIKLSVGDPTISITQFIELCATILHLNRTISMLADDTPRIGHQAFNGTLPDSGEVVMKRTIFQLWEQYYQVESELRARLS